MAEEVKISAVILTYNEEKDIERCINSVQPVVDDIVIIDSFSTDKTKEICLNLGVRFVEHKFEGHIQQKNWGITQARYPHVLSLDADEALCEKLQQSILEVKSNWKHDGYYFNRMTNYLGKWIKHCGWYPDKKLRLWDSRKGTWGGVNPHDKYILKEGCTQAYLKGDILHYSYHSIWQHIEQVNKFSEIGAQQLYERGKKASVFKIIIKSIWKFKRDYFFKGGIWDGYYGFIICAISAHATFVRYVKLREMYRDGNK